MLDYYDVDALYEKNNADEVLKYELYQAAMLSANQKKGLKQTLVNDMGALNDILNKREITEGEKYFIASLLKKVSSEYLNAVETVESYENYVTERVGKKKMDEYTKEWIQMTQNELYKHIGADNMLKPSSVYLYKTDK